MTKSEELRNEAIGYGLCEEWQKRFGRNATDQEMIELYKEGIDFCINHRFPSAEYIEKNFDKELLVDNGIFVNSTLERLPMCNNDKNEYVFVGSTKAKISIKGHRVVTLWLLDDSQVDVEILDTSRASIRVYHNSKINVLNASVNQVYCYKYVNDQKYRFEVNQRKKLKI